jgi:hypothetical protein
MHARLCLTWLILGGIIVPFSGSVLAQQPPSKVVLQPVTLEARKLHTDETVATASAGCLSCHTTTDEPSMQLGRYAWLHRVSWRR